MEELIDVLDENGNKTGEILTRKQVHEKGLCHKIIVVAIIDKNGHLLMQRRTKNKASNPGKWDVSTAGHVSSGQSSVETAIREISEELGLNITEKELNYINTYAEVKKIKENYIANHICDFYIVNIEKIKIEDIIIQPSEVEQIKLCNLQEVNNMLEKQMVVGRAKVYKDLIKYLK